MPITWPATLAEDTLSGEGAKVLGRDLYDRDEISKEIPTGTWYFADHGEASDTQTSYSTWTVRVPPYCRSGDLMRVTVLARKLTGGTGYLRLIETAGPTNGAEVAVVSGVQYAPFTVELAAPSDAWADTVKTFALQSRRGGAAGNIEKTVSAVCANVRWRTP